MTHLPGVECSLGFVEEPTTYPVIPDRGGCAMTGFLTMVTGMLHVLNCGYTALKHRRLECLN